MKENVIGALLCVALCVACVIFAAASFYYKDYTFRKTLQIQAETIDELHAIEHYLDGVKLLIKTAKKKIVAESVFQDFREKVGLRRQYNIVDSKDNVGIHIDDNGIAGTGYGSIFEPTPVSSLPITASAKY